MMMMIMNNFSSTWKMMKKKVSRRIEKKIHINNKIHRKSKNGETATLGEFWDKRAVDGLKTHLLPKFNRQERMFLTEFYKGATPSTSKCPFCILPCCCLAPVCQFIMICRECALLSVQYDSIACSKLRCIWYCFPAVVMLFTGQIRRRAPLRN